LKTELEKSRNARQADVQGMRDGFRKVRQEVQGDLKGASDAWKNLGTDGKKASVTTVTPEAPPNLEEKLLTIINQHSGGITLSEVARELVIVTIVLGKAAKVLLEQGKIHKDEKVYFPGPA